jgi:photosystem II stability/assembly factor-like uncharacterized protein
VVGISSPGHVCVSNDDGATWERCLYDAYVGYGVSALKALSTGTFVLGAKGSLAKLWRSTDGGYTWIANYASRKMWDDVPISIVQLADGSVVCSMSPSGKICRSIDDGETWNMIYQFKHEMGKLIHTTENTMIIDTVYRGDPNRFYISYDGGYTWTSLKWTLLDKDLANDIFDLFHIPDTDVILAVSPRRHEVYRGSEYGAVWGEPTNLVSGYMCTFAYMSSIAFLSTGVGTIRHSFDHGVSWYPTMKIPPGMNVTSMCGTNGGHHLLVGAGPAARCETHIFRIMFCGYCGKCALCGNFIRWIMGLL